MKKLLVLVALLFPVSVCAEGIIDGFYGQLNVGGSYLQDTDFDNNISGVGTISVEEEYDFGYAFSGSIGGKVLDTARVEIELSYKENDIDSVGGKSWDGEVVSKSIMVNGIYDIDIKQPFTPYVGAGIGLVNSELKATGQRLEDTSLGFQAMAGVSYAIEQNLALDLGYKFQYSEHDDLVGAGTNKVEWDSNYHTVMVGLRYTF